MTAKEGYESKIKELRGALLEALERLEASQPPAFGATDNACRRARKALAATWDEAQAIEDLIEQTQQKEDQL